VNVDGPTLMLGDNMSNTNVRRYMSVVLYTKVPSSVLKKKHNAIAYYCVQEAIAAKVMRFAYVKSDLNVSDIMTKPLSNERFHQLVKNWLFLVPKV
jgi:hypothetical protein